MKLEFQILANDKFGWASKLLMSRPRVRYAASKLLMSSMPGDFGITAVQRMRCCDREHHNWTDYDTREERWNTCLADMDRDACPGFSGAKDVSDASISVCCPVRPE